ncbi:unnamed protein product [Effrenium voratum]|uniref:Uncharacterized protein n=1 Tax=Effrenium voratum TaxID=2562239 RepID=A0AA36MN47_9DINO|nr:unnamed protein product [Effrenium voratum]
MPARRNSFMHFDALQQRRHSPYAFKAGMQSGLNSMVRSWSMCFGTLRVKVARRLPMRGVQAVLKGIIQKASLDLSKTRSVSTQRWLRLAQPVLARSCPHNF